MAQPLLDDALWARLEPLLPKPRRRARRRGGRPRVSERAALTGILFVLRGGLPWQMLPREMGCGSGSTCWRRLVEWERAGVWRRLHETLLAELRRRDGSTSAGRWWTAGRTARCAGEKNWTEPNRSPQGGVQTPHRNRCARGAAGGACHGRERQRHHPPRRLGRGLARRSRAPRAAAPTARRPTGRPWLRFATTS
jgi:transposase